LLQRNKRETNIIRRKEGSKSAVANPIEDDEGI
jgi:hypothetical protein